MDVLKLYLNAIIFLLNSEHFYSFVVVYDCDDPRIAYTKTLLPYKSIPGFNDSLHVHLIYDNQVKRAEFLSLVLDRELVRAGRSGCKVFRARAGVFPPDVPGRIVPEQLGGSCDVKNIFPQYSRCNSGMWKTFEGWLMDDVQDHGRVKYCVQLFYADEKVRRPYKYIARAFTFPENKYLHSMALNNSIEGDCNQLRHDVSPKLGW